LSNLLPPQVVDSHGEEIKNYRGDLLILTVGVLCGGFPEAELLAAGCIAIYRDPTDLLARYNDSPLAK
jgi:hypothetical protein